MNKIQDLTDCKQALAKADAAYNNQPRLTPRLDGHSGDFSEQTLLEIVLWKTNRYPEISNELIHAINDLRRGYEEEKARMLLRMLLNSPGFDLPMASTVLRFAVPEHLQIIDQRVYRFITEEDCLKIPHNVEQKIDLYFRYIALLKEVCARWDIPFFKADRVLYQLDKIYNKDIRLKTS